MIAIILSLVINANLNTLNCKNHYYCILNGVWLTKIILCCVWQPIFDSFLFCNILLYKIISSSRSKIVAYFINRCRWCEMQIILLMPNVGFKRCCYSAIWDQTCPITRFYFTNHNRHQPTPSICSIGIWHARYSRLTQRATLTTGSSISFGPVIKASFPKVCYCKQQNNICWIVAWA